MRGGYAKPARTVAYVIQQYVILRSSTSDDLIVPAVRLTSIGSRAFPVAGARIWNTLPSSARHLCLIVDCI